MGAEVVEVVADLPSDVVAHYARGDANRVGDAFRVRAAVTLHDQAVEAKEDRAVVVIRIEMMLEQVERRAGQGKAGLRTQRALERAAKQVGDETRCALGGLQGDVG